MVRQRCKYEAMAAAACNLRMWLRACVALTAAELIWRRLPQWQSRWLEQHEASIRIREHTNNGATHGV